MSESTKENIQDSVSSTGLAKIMAPMSIRGWSTVLSQELDLVPRSINGAQNW